MFSGFWRRVAEALRRNFVAGLLVMVPVGFTILSVLWIVNQLDQLVLPRIFEFLGVPADQRPPFVGAVFTLCLILLGGALARSFVGANALRLWERAVDQIPVARSLYAVLKQFMQAIFGSASQQFSHVVLIEYPRRGVWSYAFLTGHLDDSVPGVEGTDLPLPMIQVFIPSTPNPTTGYFLLLPEEDVRLTDLTVEEAFKMIVSAGIAGPEADLTKPDTPAL